MTAPDDERSRLSSVYHDYLTDERTLRRWSGDNPGNAAILRERTMATAVLVQTWGGVRTGARVLDLGCGAATTLGDDLEHTDLVRLGVDILYERVVDAHRAGRFDGEACADGSRLPLRSGSIDLITIFTVFSSIGDDAICAGIGREAARVLRPGGAVLFYDFRYRNPWNRNTHPVSRRRAAACFPGFDQRWHLVTLLPPLARRLGPATDHIYPWLARLPGARSHRLGLFTKR